jgi:hypothetical protein
MIEQGLVKIYSFGQKRVGNIFSEKIDLGSSDGIVLVRSCITILLSVLHNDLVYQPQVGEESFQ